MLMPPEVALGCCLCGASVLAGLRTSAMMGDVVRSPYFCVVFSRLRMGVACLGELCVEMVW
jgi:hypothetical protein